MLRSDDASTEVCAGFRLTRASRPLLILALSDVLVDRFKRPAIVQEEQLPRRRP